MFSFVDTALQISSSSIICLDYASVGVVLRLLRSWFDNLPLHDQSSIRRLSSHSVDMLIFVIPEGFVDDILPHWVPKRNIFKIDGHEMTLTLEEWA